MTIRWTRHALLMGVLIFGLAWTPGFAFGQSPDGPLNEDTPTTLAQETEREVRIEEEEERVEEEERRDGVRVEPREEERVVEDRDDEREVEVRERERVTVEEERERPHWTWIIGRNAFMGGLVGFGVWLIQGVDSDAWIIAQFAGGGIIVGAATGAIEALLQPDIFAAQKPSSIEWMERDLPDPVQIRLFKLNF